jgi:hypothetical protein
MTLLMIVDVDECALIVGVFVDVLERKFHYLDHLLFEPIRRCAFLSADKALRMSRPSDLRVETV